MQYILSLLDLSLPHPVPNHPYRACLLLYSRNSGWNRSADAKAQYTMLYGIKFQDCEIMYSTEESCTRMQAVKTFFARLIRN